MKIAVSSDWHGNPPRKSDRKLIESCDLLLLAGDIFETSHYEDNILDPLGKFFLELREKNIPVVMTPGNHDFHIYNGYLQEHPELKEELFHRISPRLPFGINRYPYTQSFLKKYLGINVLIDEPLEIFGLKIYGTPWSPEFCRWAFMMEDSDLANVFQKIPTDIDILLVHTPPKISDCRIDMVEGELDRHCGSIALKNTLLENNVWDLFCGHIHSGDHQQIRCGNTWCQNVSYLNESYTPAYPIHIMEIG